ncbi:DUF3291 domain-containing protein [Muricauda sp. SCSIO 64092]|uniref:DUF3291 domain-containing protein n=1 Tax=Allomuricauda sp. SCSIO 64092 TaxID=2908842 RepID=UPI001FF10E19|nr:DUF3291 domain-containing protein [Muricauda sp. SCSIO 64092]UOY05057.1 DUF3291 domain-containing protein [Muricauda sp. SCSIO 64092]
MEYYLAQANIARFKAQLDHPIMKEFVDFLEPVNKFAEESPGFVWRLKDNQGRPASYIQSPFKDENMAVNISLWEDVDAFKAFVYGSVHSYFLRNKKKWFDVKGPSQFVLWWLPKGELPTLDMAKEKLEFLEQNGASPQAFTMAEFYDCTGHRIEAPLSRQRMKHNSSE